MIIDKNGIRCYTDENNKIVRASIMEFTDEAKNILSKNETKKIYIESPDCNIDFQLLEKMNNLEVLEIHIDYKMFDISFVNKLKKLTGLGVGRFTGILSHKGIKDMGYKWHKKSDISQCSNIEYLAVVNCADMELFMSQIKELKKLRRMVFWRISSPAFPKTESGTPVTWLEFMYCPRIIDLEELSSNFPNLTHLSFDHCKNIQDYSPLARLKELEELIILESAPIADLSFLTEMKKLSLLKTFKTKITAKNVEVLDEIPAKLDLFLTGIK